MLLNFSLDWTEGAVLAVSDSDGNLIGDEQRPRRVIGTFPSPLRNGGVVIDGVDSANISLGCPALEKTQVRRAWTGNLEGRWKRPKHPLIRRICGSA
jgi:hypothetical protein